MSLVIKVENISKKYTIGNGVSSSLRETIVGKWDSFIGKIKSETEEFWALKDISFEVKQGDVLGIIGKNGAGKSTLLKILSRITEPTTGRIEINGRVSSLLEVGTGFHPELTGRENIYLNGTILGMTRKEVKAKFDEIVDFSGVEKFIDTPVKHYSSGMYVRLAFAVAAHLEPEILIIDEVLAVGDAEFQKKCLGKMKDVAGQGRTVLFVSHNMGAVRQMCTHGLLLNQGYLEGNGIASEIINQYLKARQEKGIYLNEGCKKDIYFKKIEVLNPIEMGSTNFLSEQDIKIRFVIETKVAIDYTFKIIVRVMNQDKQFLFSSEKSFENDKQQYTLLLPKNSLTKGEYSLSCIIYKPAVTQYDNVDDCCVFTIINNNATFSHLEGFNIGSVYKSTIWE